VSPFPRVERFVTEPGARPALTVEVPIMSLRFTTLLLSLSLASLFAGGCDPKNAAKASGAIGTQPLPAKPGPDGVTPTIPPQVDPLHDPADEPFELPLPPRGIDVDGGGPVPWKLQNPAAKGGCTCKMLCTYLEDGRIDCIENCVGTGC
jgi:hypothetical protein